MHYNISYILDINNIIDRIFGMKKYWDFIMDLLKGYKKKYIFVLVLLLFSVIMQLFSTYMSKIVVDCFTSTNGIEDIYQPELLGPVGNLLVAMLGGADFIMTNKWILAIGILVFGIILAASFIIRGFIRSYIMTSISSKIRLTLFYHIERLPYSYIKMHTNGDILQTCMKDESTLRNFIGRQFMGLANTLFMLITSFTILVTISWKIALCSIAVIPILVIYSIILLKKESKLYRQSDDAEAVVIGRIEENINSIRVVKAYNNENYEINQFSRELDDYYNITKRWNRLSAFFYSSSDILVFGEIIFTTLFSAYLAFKGEISTGTLVVAFSFTADVIWPIRDSVQTLASFAKAAVAIDRMKNLLDEPLEDIDSGEEPEIKGNIEFKDTCFRYPDGGSTCLDNLNLNIKAGETVALMGRTGSGKSTLVYLLSRLYDYNSGSIKVDGVELKDISKKCVRKNVSLVLQEPFLFSRTIYQNMTIADEHADMASIEEAIKIADLDKTVAAFKDGYDTVIGERGTTLSGGQKQRLAMARTILKDSPILIFDDSLSAVDAETDLRIRTELQKRGRKSTTIIITHKVMTAKDADKIVVLDKGKIMEIGNHDELIKNNGFYKQIYEMQTRVE